MAKTERATAGIPLWPTQTFTYGPVTGTVERKTVGHQVLEARVLAALPLDADREERLFRNLYAQTIAQTVQVDGLLLPWPGHDASPEEFREGFLVFLRLDAALHDAWWEAILNVNKPFNTAEFWPSHLLTEDERKNLASAGKPGKATSGAASPTSLMDPGPPTPA